MKSPDQAAFKIILAVVMLFAILMLPQAVEAASHAGGPPTFEQFDADGDGYISEEEFLSLRSERMAAKAKEGRQMKGAASAPAFSTIDSNGDGRLDRAEFEAGRQAHMKAMHAQHGSGKGMQHGKGRKMPAFGDLDLNGDGCIDAEEFAKHQAEMHGSRHGGGHSEDDSGS
jgi:hypothetical protein